MPKLRSVGDVAQRFTHTVLNDNGRAFYVVKAVSQNTVEGQYLGEDTGRVVLELNSELCQPFHVGFVFYRKYAIYTERVPARRVLQGLHPNNMRTSKGNPDAILYTKDFADALAGKYPTVKQAVKYLTKMGYYSVPVSREFALEGERLRVIYQDVTVGEFVNGKVVLQPAYQYLKEMVEEVFNEEVD